MTSEIAIMNRQAAVLAADSAGTVTTWVNGREEKRYLKGENKIFQCSDHHPVGLMTFGNADLQLIPWELIIKAFRAQLGNRSFADISSYAVELFNFISSNADILPFEDRDQFFLRKIVEVSFKYLLEAKDDDAVKAAGDPQSTAEAYSSFLAKRRDLLDSSSFSAPFDQDDLDRALIVHGAEVERRIDGVLESLGLGDAIDSEQLYKLAFTSLLKQYPNHLPETGIVVAGYGEQDYLPKLVEYRCYGSFLGKTLFEGKNRQEITLDKTSEIVGFASTAMVDTFTTGISPDAYYHIVTAFKSAVQSFARALEADLGSEFSNLSERIEFLRGEFVKSWYWPCLNAHYEPLRRVVGMLPVDEMAELAETLINLESLKEKVTQPTQSVGGPIDVAVISKIDGFIWVKRKHYFRPELNPRFFSRKYGRLAAMPEETGTTSGAGHDGKV